MSDQAFLRAIIDDPDNDVLRLVYADWLDEHGNPDRAEFIRDQIHLSTMKPWDDRYLELDIRCRELHRLHPEWIGWLRPFANSHSSSVFDRGFVSRISLLPSEFVEHHDRLVSEYPLRGIAFKQIWVRENTWEAESNQEYLRCLAIERLGDLDFGVNSREDAKTLLACLERMKTIRHLGITGAGVRGDDMREVFGIASQKGLRSLRIAVFSREDKHLNEAAFPDLRQFTRMGLANLELLKSTWVQRLTDLILADRGELQPEDTNRLSDALPEMAALETLDLQGSVYWPTQWQPTDQICQRLGNSLARSNLKSFSLAATFPAPRIILGACAQMSLKQLRISYSHVDEEFIDFLAKSPTGAELRSCSLSDLTMAAVSKLCDGGACFPKLKQFGLGFVCEPVETDMFPKVIHSMLESEALPRLVSLSLSESMTSNRRRGNLADPIAEAISTCPGAARLRELSLAGLDGITSKGARALANSQYLNELQLLTVGAHNVVERENQLTKKILISQFGRRVKCDADYEPY